MEDTQRPVGWHADLDAHRYRYWDGERFAFSCSAGDLDAYRAAGQSVPGVDFEAPVHSELPPEEKPRRSRTPILAGGAVALVAVVAVVILLVL